MRAFDEQLELVGKLASANTLDLNPARLYSMMEIQPLRVMVLIIQSIKSIKRLSTEQEGRWK